MTSLRRGHLANMTGLLKLIFAPLKNYEDMGNYSVYLGAAGWEHARWAGDFYPEDLPEDWQLSFYNTQFRCVYLPYELWRTATDEDVANWLKESQEGFRFVLQVPENLDESVLRLARRFGERGIQEGQADCFWLDGKPDLRGLAQRMQAAAQSGTPLYLISREGDLPQMRQVSQLMELLGV